MSHTVDIPISTTRICELVHTSIYRTRYPSLGGHQYMFIIVDDYSRVTITRPLRTYTEVPRALSALITIMEGNFNRNVAAVNEESTFGRAL